MRICIYGSEGHLNTVFDYLNIDGDVQVAAVCCESAGDAEFFRDSLADQNYRVYGDFHEMIDAEKPDIAVVCSYPHKNARATGYALGKGIHVFCEKPIAITLREYEEIEKICENSGARLYSMMTERFAPEFYTAYRAIADGLVGTVRLVDARKSYKLGARPDYYRSRGTYAGTLSWVGIHAIDRIYRLSAKTFETVFARSSNLHNSGYGDLETAAVCSYTMSDGVLASFTCDYYRPSAAPTHGDDRVRVVGTGGVIEVMGGKVYYLSENQSVHLPPIDPPMIFGEFLRYIKTGKSSFLTSQDCLYTTYAALKTMEASDTGKIVNL